MGGLDSGKLLKSTPRNGTSSEIVPTSLSEQLSGSQGTEDPPEEVIPFVPFFPYLLFSRCS